MPERYQELVQWVHHLVGGQPVEIKLASNDASFRRYWRIEYEGQTRIVMDAPPDKEDCRPFIDVARRLLQAGLNVPEVLEHDLGLGFLLLTDLGEALYLRMLNAGNVEQLYGDAMERLMSMQIKARADELPLYDRRLLMGEMELFRVWLVGKELRIDLSREQHEALDRVFTRLADAALSQPRVFVHRDYHSRNLMLTTDNNPGILDFQDAVLGPVTYDLVSLLRDCYIRWPPEQVETWAITYFEHARRAGILPNTDRAGFRRCFDLMGVQRHLKASGIFARLWHRDGKAGYLGDVPRTLQHVVTVAPRYRELADLEQLLTELVLPAMERAR